ncbi:hypothetical protein [Streptomyces sp. HUAS TT20]|uniref:hypothetical protein n=1 Tax=Streptomyces sp. HUAS TT20 TaxID=3447509 RepID=UPI0021D9312D|nr:hypothetical protein [Streptomyces sp. HUAS 15-9]UXY25605.1 hypothetical protein N8I87_02840 [Streptomyces sp. HUAS 15-9]
MSSDVTCEKLREVGPELALGVLPGRERAGAVAHLDACADCREYIEQLTLVGDGLIGLLPGSEPPVGFETRVAQSLTQVTPVHEGHAREAPVPRKGRPGRARMRLVSATAAAVVAIGFSGWAVGSAIENVVAGPATSAEPVADMLSGDLTSVGAKGKMVGEVYAHADPKGWVYMTLDLPHAGTSYDGKVVCFLERKDGSTVPVGAFSIRDGSGSWGAPAPVDPSALSGARVTTPDGTVLARAPLSQAGPNE